VVHTRILAILKKENPCFLSLPRRAPLSPLSLFMRVDVSASAATAASSVDQSAALAWLLYAAVGVVLLLLSAFVVLYFQPQNAAATSLPSFAGASTISAAPLQITSRFVSIVCVLALYTALLCLFTAPVDVFLLENALPHVHANANALRILYQVYLGILAVYTFVGAPLVYNYARQTEIAHITMLFRPRQRLAVAVKRTLCFLLGLGVLLALAMALLLCGKPTSSDIDWLKPLLHLSTDLAALFRLVIGILVLSGVYLWVFVCARGLACVPLVGLLMEDHGENENKTTFEDLLRENAMETQATDQTKDTILKRYVVDQRMSRLDSERLEQLRLREQLLKDRRAVLHANLERFSQTNRWGCWRVPLGLVLLLCSLLLLVSMLITSLDKMVHSSFAKGFLLDAPRFPNPIDGLLVLASRSFPLDYILFGLVFVYFFAVSFIVLLRHGVRVLCFRLDRLQPRLTSASTMTMVSLIMIYLAIVGLFSVLTLAPQYATFGHQRYADPETGVVLPCTLRRRPRARPTRRCHATAARRSSLTSTTRSPCRSPCLAWRFSLGSSRSSLPLCRGFSTPTASRDPLPTRTRRKNAC
jgi:LMBR1 domain-containing protein 1